VSHELRSPLNAILGFADILLSEVDGPLEGEAREEVAVIKQSGLHLLSLINDILELSAIASQQLQLQREPIELVPIAQKVLREAMGARGEKPVELRLETTAPTITAFADGKRVRQILTNLVGNALKFTTRGEVVVTIEGDAHYATIRVRDTGPGIPKQDRETIFDEYRQSGDRRSRRRGTGLGLAIARRLAMMHGGSVSLESTVGVGSTFVLRLPVRAPKTTTRSDLPTLVDETGAYGSVTVT
jgi:signal transduction histidine kinase